MKMRNLTLSLGTIIPIVVAYINYTTAKPLSWNYDNLNTISFTLMIGSLFSALLMLFLNKEKEVWIWFLAGGVAFFDIVWLLLGYSFTHFGF